MYKLDSLCKYDAVVHKRAGKKGVEEFGIIQHNVMLHISHTITRSRLQIRK